MFVPHATSVGEGSRVALVLHGIFGSGNNFRSFAKRLAAQAPGVRFLLCDLRAHGASLEPPPPHTVRASAADLLRLEASLGVRSELVVGHSFGGKVALQFAAQRRAQGDPLRALWVLDASPGARAGANDSDSSDAEGILGWLEALPWPLPSRERFSQLATELGLPRPIADWLAMNVRRTAAGDYDFRVDLAVARELLRDYFALDLWQALEDGVADEVGIAVGGRSRSLGPDERARLAALERAGKVRVVVLPEAGHWVHVDDPDGLARALLPTLCSPRSA